MNENFNEILSKALEEQKKREEEYEKKIEIANNIVLCKDCEYWTKIAGVKICTLHSIAIKDNDFCSFGKYGDDV